MTKLLSAELALAFNSVNERKSWQARPYCDNNLNEEFVHFTAPNNTVTLVYECEHNRFSVRFNKVYASWGDYIKAIARTLYVVLTTLKQAGQPFDAPDGPEGIEIIATATAESTVYVRWPGQTPDVPLNPIMPELVENLTLAAGYPGLEHLPRIDLGESGVPSVQPINLPVGESVATD